MLEALAALEKTDKRAFRMTLVILQLAGVKTRALSDITGIQERTLNRWRLRVRKGGPDALLENRATHAGRPPKLTPLQIGMISDTIQEPASQVGFESWTPKSLRDFILISQNENMSLKWCAEFLKKHTFFDDEELLGCYFF